MLEQLHNKLKKYYDVTALIRELDLNLNEQVPKRLMIYQKDFTYELIEKSSNLILCKYQNQKIVEETSVTADVNKLRKMII